MMIKKLFPIFKQRSHRSKSGTTARDFPTASVLPARGKIALSKGFTLAELLVVMGMTAIMIAVTLTSLSGAKDRKAVEAEARKFAAVVREMQNYALTGKVMETGRVTCGVGIFEIEDDDESYVTSYAYRSGTSCADSPTFALLSPIILSNGVAFSGTTDAFYFRVPRGDMMDALGAGIATARLIVLHKNTADYSVCVYPSGMVVEQAGSGSCP